MVREIAAVVLVVEDGPKTRISGCGIARPDAAETKSSDASATTRNDADDDVAAVPITAYPRA
jgi:hypothetical protein